MFDPTALVSIVGGVRDPTPPVATKYQFKVQLVEVLMNDDKGSGVSFLQ